MSTKFPPEIVEKFREWGRKGGLAGSREKKRKAAQDPKTKKKRARTIMERFGAPLDYGAMPDAADQAQAQPVQPANA